MEPLKATSLDDLADVVVNVPVERPDGRTVIVPMRALSEGAVFARRAAMDWPKPQLVDMTKSGPVYDDQHPAYLAEVRAANRRFTYLLLLDALGFEVPGASEDERIAELQRRLGNSVYMQLVQASNKLNYVTEEQIATLAQSFRADGAAGAPVHAAAAPDAGTVAQPA